MSLSVKTTMVFSLLGMKTDMRELKA